MKTVKPVDSNATLKDDLEHISTFELVLYLCIPDGKNLQVK